MSNPTLSNDVIMQQKRGLLANLPTSAPSGQLLVTTDTNELFVGTGTGVAPISSKKHQTKYTLYEDNAGVYADGLPGTFDPKGREGWYFTNASVGQKVNWYYYDPTQITTLVQDFKSAYAIVTLDTNRVPFFAVYTAGNAFGWYQSRRVYGVQSPSSVVPGKYLIHTGTDPGVYTELPRIVFTETASLSNGAFGANETIAYVTLQTDSGVSVGNYKFVTHQLGFKTNALTQELDLKLKSDATRIHTQTSASTTWNIVHRMGKRPSVTTVDTTGTVIEGRVVYNSDIQATVYFGLPVAGLAYLN